MKNLLSNIKDWITRHKVASIIIGVLLLTVIIGPIAEEQEKDEQAKVEQNEKETTQPEEKESKSDEVAEKSEELETEAIDTDVEEIEQPEVEGLSPEFKENTSDYFMQLSSAYSTLGDLTYAETEIEMMTVIKSAQSEYDLTNEYFAALDPQTEEEKEIFKKISKVDGLAARALMNAEDGLSRQDVDTIESATEDIEESSVVMDDIMNDIE